MYLSLVGCLYYQRSLLVGKCYLFFNIFRFMFIFFLKYLLNEIFMSNYSLGGLVLDSTIGKFNGFVVFQPIINGIGGNLVSVQASKISTMLHQSSILGIVPPYTKILESPYRALVKGGEKLSFVMSMTGVQKLTLLLNLFYSSLCKNRTYSFTYDNTSSRIRFRCRCYSYKTNNDWNVLYCDLLACEPVTSKFLHLVKNRSLFSSIFNTISGLSVTLHRSRYHSLDVEAQDRSRQLSNSLFNSNWRSFWHLFPLWRILVP